MPDDYVDADGWIRWAEKGDKDGGDEAPFDGSEDGDEEEEEDDD